ncbi:MAG TPA: universal stress protein [Acidimicrobiia bacterium]|nr:universal stress protein [Acidimicrobiia bacterium]
MAAPGPVEELASKDAYLAEAEGRVLEVVKGGILLDRTVFYARGGGQPGDIGVLRWDGGEVEVLDTIRHEGKPLHVVDAEAALPGPGTSVYGVIDWERRYRTMKTHTALHALSGVVFRDFGAKVTGGNMEPGMARMDFELDGISVEFGQQVERKLNEELTKGYPTEILYLARQEALQDPDLIRTKVNLIPEWVEEIRVVDIVGLDRQADGGTHVASTLEVGHVTVVKTESKGKANKRMRIELTGQSRPLPSVHQSSERHPMSVIVGYLSSDRGIKALERGIEEAKLRNTNLVVVHSLHGVGKDDDEDVIKSDRDIAALEESLQGKGVEFSVHNYVRGNEPAQDLIRAAEEFDGELIVIGLRQRSSAGKFLLGSNAHDILMDAPCPVLTVKAD